MVMTTLGITKSLVEPTTPRASNGGETI